MTPILISRFFLDLDDLTLNDHSRLLNAPMYMPKMGVSSNDLLSIQFVDPGSTTSVCHSLAVIPRLIIFWQAREYARTALGSGGLNVDQRLEESEPALKDGGHSLPLPVRGR